jgi:malonyl-CoA/methylmalonyl-CoA synthetase
LGRVTPPTVARAYEHPDRIALVASEGQLSYRQLLEASGQVANRLLAGRSDLKEARIAYLVPPSLDWVVVQWGVWRAGGVAVPLAVSHPSRELEFVLDDAEPETVVLHPDVAGRVRPAAERRGLRILSVPSAARDTARTEARLPKIAAERAAQMIYTSGTTGRPKGVVSTHANVAAQILSLVEAWSWTAEDRILLVLPLHHVHGIVNVLGCALWSGACCEIHASFDAEAVWNRFAAGGLTLFMAVPTIYARLIRAWEAAAPTERSRWSAGARRLRLMVSGSAALPVGVLERWEEITGQRLLERYGMTEIGMGLGNPLRGRRRPGHVGVPFPGVEIRLVGEDGTPAAPGAPGEIQIRGPQVFREYWRRPEETRAAFVDGWFRTGDVAVEDEGSYRILGRRSVDIIKTGGEKVSALEVEEVLREHPAVRDCAVVGIPDDEWGERVAAAVVPAGRELDVSGLVQWARDRLAPYKVPRLVSAIPELPVNAMGKVTKPAVRSLLLDTASATAPAHARSVGERKP